jgi:hypothetical protein
MHFFKFHLRSDKKTTVEPVHQLINATIEELVDNLIRGKLAESENKCEQRIHLIE